MKATKLCALLALLASVVLFSLAASAESIEQLTKLAEGGNANAQVRLAGWYYQQKDYVQSAAWHRKAAEQGNPQGQLQLGNYYLQGLGVEKNENKAVEWLRKSANQGNAWGQLLLGGCYNEGIGGLPVDAAQAVAWFRKAAEQGLDGAQFSLAAMYEKGSGVTRSYAEAAKWYRAAAAQGYEGAQNKWEELARQSFLSLTRDLIHAWRNTIKVGDQVNLILAYGRFNNGFEMEYGTVAAVRGNKIKVKYGKTGCTEEVEVTRIHGSHATTRHLECERMAQFENYFEADRNRVLPTRFDLRKAPDKIDVYTGEFQWLKYNGNIPEKFAKVDGEDVPDLWDKIKDAKR